VLSPFFEYSIRPVCNNALLSTRTILSGGDHCGSIRPYTWIATDLHTCISFSDGRDVSARRVVDLTCIPRHTWQY
jgi:hypothetical protein